ncbi:MAG: MoaD/ThiS family protein [Candidatus Heimdallarchaeota archaeon]
MTTETIIKRVICDQRKSVEALLMELGLSSSFIVLINGKIAKLNSLIDEGDEIIILPLLAGGS